MEIKTFLYVGLVGSFWYIFAEGDTASEALANGEPLAASLKDEPVTKVKVIPCFNGKTKLQNFPFESEKPALVNT